MKKQYKFTYDNWCEIVFEVDTAVFTKEHAKSFLRFFVWEYNADNDLIEEALFKMAIKCFYSSVFKTKAGIIKLFEEAEGYFSLDGSEGITLIDVDEFEIDNDSLELEVEEVA